jgi:hypothetical protein
LFNFKQRLGEIKFGRSRSAPQRHVRAPLPSVFVPVRRSRRPSPKAARRPRPRSSRGRPHPTTHRSPRPRHAPACHTRRASRTCTPRSGGPSVTPRPRASYYGRDITPSSPLVGPPIFKRPPFVLEPPDPAPAAPPRPSWPPPVKPPPCSLLGHRARE